MEFNPNRIFINIELLKFAAYLGMKYQARVISWGRDLHGNRDAGSKLDDSWHRWIRGSNAIDLKPQNPRSLALMADEAKKNGYQTQINRTSVHIEVSW